MFKNKYLFKKKKIKFIKNYESNIQVWIMDIWTYSSNLQLIRYKVTGL